MSLREMASFRKKDAINLSMPTKIRESGFLSVGEDENCGFENARPRMRAQFQREKNLNLDLYDSVS